MVAPQPAAVDAPDRKVRSQKRAKEQMTGEVDKKVVRRSATPVANTERPQTPFCDLTDITSLSVFTAAEPRSTTTTQTQDLFCDEAMPTIHDLQPTEVTAEEVGVDKKVVRRSATPVANTERPQTPFCDLTDITSLSVFTAAEPRSTTTTQTQDLFCDEAMPTIHDLQPTEVTAEEVGVVADRLFVAGYVDCAYDLVQQIGSGSYGNVYGARQRVPGSSTEHRDVAIKVVHWTEDEVPDYVISECALHMSVQHSRHVVDLLSIHVHTDSRSMILVMPRMSQTLSAYIQTLHNHNKEPWSVQHTVAVHSVTLQLASAVEYLHSKRIIHRDLKPQNMLMNTDDTRVVLCDLGMAVRQPETMSVMDNLDRTEYVTSRYYRAPELWSGQSQSAHRTLARYSATIDMWSLGCILMELCMGSVLLPGRSPAEQASLSRQDAVNNTITRRLEEALPAKRAGTVGKLVQVVSQYLLRTSPSCRASANKFRIVLVKHCGAACGAE